MAFAKPALYEHLTGRGPVLTLLQPLLRRNSTTAVRALMTGAGRKRKVCFREAYAKSSHSVHDTLRPSATRIVNGSSEPIADHPGRLSFLKPHMARNPALLTSNIWTSETLNYQDVVWLVGALARESAGI
ncbi:hypothetical protein AJ88_01675 [Mesorhizobium amorphae CCBAU 01583]|nr:hypothetical protein AJ88_01675 [Mesorhizobium amorphae CCBAU 01583]